MKEQLIIKMKIYLKLEMIDLQIVILNVVISVIIIHVIFYLIHIFVILDGMEIVDQIMNMVMIDYYI